MVRALLEARPDLAFSVSCTTRAPRPGEQDGVHYRFVKPSEFDRLVAEDAFLEWAEVFGERYGTLAASVEEARRAGRDILLEVDVQGARRIRERAPDALMVFLLPPSEDELVRRLIVRGAISLASLEERLSSMRWEMEQDDMFDGVVINDRIDEAVRQVLAIIDGTGATPPPDQGDTP